MRHPIDSPEYRDSNVGEGMIEPKHGHSNHTFTKETRICAECLEEIEAKAKLADEYAAALSDMVNEMYVIDRGDTRARPCIKRAEAILPMALGGER